MRAGKELDALVEEVVFGNCAHNLEKRWESPYPEDDDGVRGFLNGMDMHYECTKCHRKFSGLAYRVGTFVRPYSTELAFAWRIVEEVAKTHHWKIESPFDPSAPEHYGDLWWVGCTEHGISGWNGRPDFRVANASPCEAICKAALLSKGHNVIEEDEIASVYNERVGPETKVVLSEET